MSVESEVFDEIVGIVKEEAKKIRMLEENNISTPGKSIKNDLIKKERKVTPRKTR